MKDYEEDVYRYYGKYRESLIQRLCRPDGLKYMRVFRKCNNGSALSRMLNRLRLKRLQRRTFIQIPCNTKIGSGFYIGHNGRIVINEGASIGKNCNIATGVVIGQENRGKRKGCPTIGNYVWIGANAAIVGKNKIGDDVLIAPLAYVNFDVPDHSVVIGNPGRIIPKNDATGGYINRTVEN